MDNPIYINGHEVDYFDYNESTSELEAIDLSGRILVTFSMSKKQWKKIQKKRNAWKYLGILFGDKEED